MPQNHVFSDRISNVYTGIYNQWPNSWETDTNGVCNMHDTI